MNKFRKLGLITYNGRIETHNSLLDAVSPEKPETQEDLFMVVGCVGFSHLSGLAK